MEKKLKLIIPWSKSPGVTKMLRCMKLTFTIFLLTVLQTWATVSYSQSTTLSINLRNVTVQSVLQQIEDQSEFYFLYSSSVIDVNRTVSMQLRNAKITEVLNMLFKESDVAYKVDGRQIVLSKKSEATETQGQQQKSVSGKVTDSSGSPLPGVSVVVKGTTTGTITDGNGNYSLPNVPENATLQFSFVGMKGQEVKVGSQTLINVVLTEETIGIDEVVAVGYGKQKKTTMTGSVSNIKGNDIARVPVSNISNSLGGKLAGVMMRPDGAQPGKDNANIHIRGIATTGSNAPLVVVDGIIRDNISQIDPSIIESVSVLKDAAAVAPYGLGGANGVILITTKSGQISAPKLSLNSYYGFQTPTYRPKFLDAKDYMRLSNEAYLNENPGKTTLPYSTDLINNYDALNAENPDLYANSNYEDLLNFSIPVQNHNLQLTGGTDKLKYFAGIGYFKQNGMVDVIDYSRFSYNMRLEAQVTNTTKLTLSTIGTIENRNDFDDAFKIADYLFYSYKYVPTHPIYYSNGLYGQFAGISLVGVLNAGYTKDNGNTSLNTFTVEQDLPFIPGLSVKGTVSYDNRINFEKGWHTPYYHYEQNTNTTPYTYTKTLSTPNFPTYTYLRQTHYKRQAYTYQGFINYQRSFGKHDLSGLIVAEARENLYEYMYARRNNYSISVDELNMGSSSKIDYDNDGSSSVGTQIGYVYRLGYIYANKYMVEASGRYDGHYYFAPEKKWGYFPSIALGWRLSEEKFMKEVKFVDNLKIRGSLGKSGNLAGSPYQYLSGYTLAGNGYAFGAGNMVQRAYAPREANPNITWEISTKSDLGFEATLFKNLLTVEADYFFEKRTGMLLPPAVTVPIEYGLALADENAGEMENHGFELTVGTKHRLNNGMNIGLNGNFSFAKNKVTQVFETPATFNNPNRKRTGRALGTPFGYHSLGLFSTDDDKNKDGIINSLDGYNVVQFGVLHPGDIKYQDVSGPNGDMVPDGKIDRNDEVVIGNPVYPLMSFGFTATAEWKGFDLSLFFQGSGMVSFNIQNHCWCVKN